MGRSRTTEVDPDTFAGRVAINTVRLREKQKLKVVEAAEAAGIPFTVWYRIERGNSPRTAGEQFDALVAYFECTLADLLKPPKD